MTEPRRRARPKPPAGIVYITDWRDKDSGLVIDGIATRLGLTSSTYRKWRMAGRGPHAFLIGGRVVARIAEIEAWIAQQERNALPIAA